MEMKPHVPAPKSTPAYFCANGGAIALDPNPTTGHLIEPWKND